MGNVTAPLELSAGWLQVWGGSGIWKTIPRSMIFVGQMKRKSLVLAANCLMSDRCYNHDYRILFNSEQKYLGLTLA